MSEKNIAQLLNDKDSENTKKSTKQHRLIFESYLKEKNIRNPTTAVELAAVLRKFYAEARKKDGQMYSKNSLCSIRFSLCRHFKQELNVDIIKDAEFDEANRVYGAQCVASKKQGLAKTEHKPPIADEDIEKLYRCGIFNTENPSTLQNKVFFEIMLFFCRRGRQNLRQLKKTDFEIKVNSQGKRCVVKTNAELTKNHREHDVQAEEGGMMIANDSPFCPVSSFEKYLSVLNPMNEFLFQRPKSSGKGEVWYDNMVVGENTLGKKMKVISQQAELSTTYTNHSIRATTITILDRSGFEARHIMSVSGHRNESSIKSYSKTDENTKTNMAGSLMAVIDNKKSDTEKVVAFEASKHDRNEELGLLTNSQEEFILRDLNVQTHNQSTKQFSFHNCTVTIL